MVKAPDSNGSSDGFHDSGNFNNNHCLVRIGNSYDNNGYDGGAWEVQMLPEVTLVGAETAEAVPPARYDCRRRFLLHDCRQRSSW